MTQTDLEAVYETLAEAVDAVRTDRRELLLAKIALLLAHDLNDPAAVRGRVREAMQNLDV